MLIDKLNGEIVKAMKEKKSERVETLKMIKAELQVNAVAVKKKPETEVVVGYYKKLEKNFEIPEIQNSRPEFLEKIKRELKIISEFMPKQASSEDITKIVEKHLSLNNMGAIMKEVKAELEKDGVLFDGKMVSEIIKNKLGK